MLRYTVTAIVVLAVGAFFWQALAANWSEIQAQELGFDPKMIVATVLFALAVPVSGLLWGGMVDRLSPGDEPHVRKAEAIAVHCASWLLKYVPGQVGSLVNKIAWGTRRGFSRTVIVITFIYENVFLVLAATVPSVVILAVALGVDVIGDNVATLALPILAIIPLLVLSNRAVFHRLLSPLVRRAVKQDLPVDYFLTTPATLAYQSAYLVPRVMNGVGFVFVVASITDVDATAWVPLAAAYMLAGAAGLLAIFVPSGLGVREAVIVVFAAQYMSLGEAILASLLARLLSTIADGIVALIYLGFRVSLPKEPRT